MVWASGGVGATQEELKSLQKKGRQSKEKERSSEVQKERSGFSRIKVDAAIILNLRNATWDEKAVGRIDWASRPRNIVQSLNNLNGSAPRPLGKIATQTCFSDESLLDNRAV